MSRSLLRWCIAAAVLANLLLYFWPRQVIFPTLPDLPRGAKSLVLLSELEQSSITGSIAATDPAATPELSVAAEPVPAVTAEVVAAEPGEMDADEVITAPLEAASVVALEPIEVNVQRRSLPPPPQRCWLAGPVEDNRLSEQLSADFAAAGISMDLVLRRVEVEPDHWVYLPITGTQAEVRRLSRELREAGVDNFPITSGDLAGKLSLGLFRSAERGTLLRDKVRQLGYPADIYLRSRSRDEAWIALTDADLAALLWQQQEGAVTSYEGLQLQRRACAGQNPGSAAQSD